MRISGGAWCGRKIKVPPGDKVRPTQDMVRQALFSILMNDLPGANFIDLFAGSGSVGLDALSRGAKRVTWIEKDPHNVALLKENQASLGASGEVVCSEVERWLQRNGHDWAADIAYCDPPYIIGREQGFARLMALAAENNVIRVGGVFIAETSGDTKPEECLGWSLVRDRSYGHSRIAVYLREPAK